MWIPRERENCISPHRVLIDWVQAAYGDPLPVFGLCSLKGGDE